MISGFFSAAPLIQFKLSQTLPWSVSGQWVQKLEKKLPVANSSLKFHKKYNSKWCLDISVHWVKHEEKFCNQVKTFKTDLAFQINWSFIESEFANKRWNQTFTSLSSSLTFLSGNFFQQNKIFCNIELDADMVYDYWQTIIKCCQIQILCWMSKWKNFSFKLNI